MASSVLVAACSNGASPTHDAEWVHAAPGLFHDAELQLYDVTRSTHEPNRLLVAGDGSVWYTVVRRAMVVRVRPDGTIQRWRIDNGDRGSTAAEFIAEGLDGSIWFDYVDQTESSCRGGVGHIVNDRLKIFHDSCVGFPWGIAIGADGRLYVVKVNAGIVEVYDATGRVAAYTLPHENGWADANFMTAGPDGNLWISADHFVIKMSVAGDMTAYRVASNKDPQPFIPQDITGGADGNVWFIEQQANGSGQAVAKITPRGRLTRYLLAYPHVPVGITRGPRRDIWFIDGSAGATVGSVSPAGEFAYHAVGSTLNPGFYTIGAAAGATLEVGGRVDRVRNVFFVGSVR